MCRLNSCCGTWICKLGSMKPLLSLPMVRTLSCNPWPCNTIHAVHYANVGGNLTVEYFPGTFGDLLIWEETALYYSPNGGMCRQSLLENSMSCIKVYVHLTNSYYCVGLTVDPLHLYSPTTGGTLEPLTWEERESMKQVVTGMAYPVIQCSYKHEWSSL